MKFFLTLISIIVCFCNTHGLKAQQVDTLEIIRNANGIISFARFNPNSNRKMLEGANFLNEIFNVKSDYEYRLLNEYTD